MMKQMRQLAPFMLFFVPALAVSQQPVSPDWTDPTPIPDAGGPATGNVGNNMAILSTGRIILIYNQTLSQGGMKLYLTSTGDDGASWQIPAALSVADTLIGSSTATLAADVDDVLHLTWTAKLPVKALYYSKSTDGGASWSPAQILYQEPRHKIAYHSVTVDRKRRVHVSWHDGDTDEDTMPAETWYARSVDQGETWETARMMSTDDGMHSAFARSDFSGTDSDTLLFVWRDNRAGGDEWDVYGAFSYDGGASWSEQLIAGGSGRQWDPMALIDKHGTIHVGVMDYPAGHQIDVFVWYFNTPDGGATWSAKETIRGARTIFPFYTYDFTNDIIWYFLRLESPPGGNPISDLGGRYTTDGGASWSELEQLTALHSGGTKFPAIVTGLDGIVRVSYSLKDSNGDDRLYFQKRTSVPQANYAQEPETFFTIHCEPQNPHLFPRLIELVDIANNHGVPLTIQFTPPWVEAILADSNKVERVRTWQQQGHEIAAHHHGVYHLHWDGFTNYPESVILSQGKSLSDFRGDMDAYRAVVEPAGGDSLMLTMSGPGLVDPDSSVDWQPDFLYRTGGGRDVVRAFSSPRLVGMGQYTACQIDHFFIDSQTAVNSLKGKYNNTTEKDVVGAVTHVFNFVNDSTYVIDWFEFVQNTRRKTARQIMRDRDCTPTPTDVAFDDWPVPASLQLAQNYPNPFNPQTAISYTIPPPHAGIPFVQLKIYNTLGQVVRTLVGEFQRAGDYTVVWDGRNDRGQQVGSGIYLYKLEAGQQVQARRMVLLR